MSLLPRRTPSSRLAGALVALYRGWTRLYPTPVRVHDRKEMVACFAQMVDAAQADPSALRLLRFVLHCALSEPLVLAAVWRDQLMQTWQYYQNIRRHSGGSLMFDLRQASRQLLRRPGVTLLIVLCLGIGVGATTSLLSAVDAVLWRSQPVLEPERLVRVFEVDEHGVHDLNHGDFMTIQESTESLFDGLSVHRLETFALQPGNDRTAGATRVVYGELVSSSYFDMLQAPLALGQTFSSESEPAEGRLAAVISHHLFEAVFDGDPDVIGRIVRLDDVPIEILGVMQPEFQGTKFGLAMDLWVPVRPWGHAKNWPDQWESQHRGSSWYSLGRLEDGVSFEQVQGSLDRVADELAELYPETHERTGFRLYDNRLSDATPHGGEAAGLISTLAILGGALVLLVACSNVAALMLARGATRSGELNIRAALGAGRGRLVSGLMSESLILALLGGLAGLSLAFLGPVVLERLQPPLPYRMGVDFTPQPRILAIGLVVALASSLLFGLWPALRATGAVRLSQGQRSSGTGRSTSRALDSVVVAMVALSFVSLVLAGLFQRSLSSVRAMDPGFETQSRVLAAFDTSLAGDPNLDTVEFYHQLSDEVAALQEVESAAVTSIVPLGDRSQASTLFADRPSAEEEADPSSSAAIDDVEGIPAWYTSVTPGFVDTMGMTLLRGRDFDRRDRADAPPVAILNETLATRLFGTVDAVSLRFRFRQDPSAPTVEVIGVVEDGRYRQMTEPQTGALLLSFDQNPTDSAYLIAKAAERPGLSQSELLAPVSTQLRSSASAIDSRVPLYLLEPLAVWVDGSLWLFRMGAFVGAGLGALALILAVAGLHGVISYSVSRRTFELGVRKALGADSRQILLLVLGRALRLGGAGVMLGAVVAWAARGGIKGLLFGVSAGDPRVLLSVGLLLCAVALIAGLRPAVGAARLDPAETLRSD